MSKGTVKWNESVPLADAALALGRSYLQTRDLLLKGNLTGFKRDGRWYVIRKALEAYKARNVPSGYGSGAGDDPV